MSRLSPARSTLYGNARAGLSGEVRAKRDAAEAWLGRCSLGSSCDGTGGKRLLENLQREAHLHGDRPHGEPDELAAFLQAWVEEHEQANDEAEREATFKRTCGSFGRKGTAVPSAVLPERLLRYVTSRKLGRRLVQSVLSKRLRHQLEHKRLAWSDAFERLEQRWDRERDRLSTGVHLAGGDVVFATFDSDVLPREDAARLVTALALPAARRGGILIELEYETVEVRDVRFPTVADAGDHDLFEPAPERAPDPADPSTCYGWTKPLAANESPQPEMVHENRPLRVVRSCPRLVGEVPKP